MEILKKNPHNFIKKMKGNPLHNNVFGALGEDIFYVWYGENEQYRIIETPGKINDFVWSSFGSNLFFGCNEGNIYNYNLETLALYNFKEKEKNFLSIPVMCCTSPENSKVLFSGLSNKTVEIWDTRTPNVVKTLDVGIPCNYIDYLDFNLLCGSSNKMVCFDLRNIIKHNINPCTENIRKVKLLSSENFVSMGDEISFCTYTSFSKIEKDVYPIIDCASVSKEIFMVNSGGFLSSLNFEIDKQTRFFRSKNPISSCFIDNNLKNFYFSTGLTKEMDTAQTTTGIFYISMDNLRKHYIKLSDDVSPYFY